MLSVHPFFEEYEQECPHVVRKICHAAMAMCTNTAGDTIFHFGETCTSMLILKDGLLTYHWGIENSQKMEHGQWLSEACLWVHWVHHGSLMVTKDSTIFKLDAASFQD